jgi:hypothetical protein
MGGHGGGALEDAFEVVVVVPVQAADLHEPGLALHLVVNHVILRAVVRLQCQSAVGLRRSESGEQF